MNVSELVIPASLDQVARAEHLCDRLPQLLQHALRRSDLATSYVLFIVVALFWVGKRTRSYRIGHPRSHLFSVPLSGTPNYGWASFSLSVFASSGSDAISYKYVWTVTLSCTSRHNER